ncbi:MAG: hypothetical protein RBR69_08065 [Candidatus Cloacimonadaceae bacterium]|jgi:hypothetical protein|nr:hypothetical protein [Candidatus Cloacimonadota bacterium]MDY0128071.1 hypothetical protein [Candidatus Cloacimonadaceae bacterium]MCB5255684.1 hypothetical protein [Candidatus Cloacimonadota bacterium]MCK9178505.1 hypothetical protein [Candidatus Cloacimonadota bacterium]MCK9242593.1 hypothetical protein [Candidatus Cloacimonadota bacterium]
MRLASSKATGLEKKEKAIPVKMKELCEKERILRKRARNVLGRRDAFNPAKSPINDRALILHIYD